MPIRDYLVSKFQFIHLRLLKSFESSKEAFDARTLQSLVDPLIETLPLPLFIKSLEGRFLYLNRSAEELTGYQREEILGKMYYETDLLSLNDLMKLATLFASHAFRQRGTAYRLTIRRKDGSRVKTELFVQLIPIRETKIIVSVARHLDEPQPAGAEAEEDNLLDRISALNRGMNPVTICSECKKVQSTQKEWIPIEYFLYKQLELVFTHGLCPSCYEDVKRQI